MKHRYSRQMQNFGAQHPSFTPWHNLMQRRVRVFDNGGKTMDRYSVCIQRTLNGKKILDIYGMSENPKAPNGFNQFSHSAANPFRDMAFLGQRVQVQDLPIEVIEAIEERIG